MTAKRENGAVRASSFGGVLLEMVGAVVFAALEFFFMFLVGFAAVVVGFARGAKKGGHK